MKVADGLLLWGRMSSINVRKVVLCAQMLALPLKRQDAGSSYGVVDTQDYRRLNPNGLVPLLQDGDFSLWESNVIVRYLCKREDSALYPRDLQTQFEAERWMDWQQTTLNRAGGPAFLQWIRTPTDQRSANVIAQSVAATEPLFDLLNQRLGQQAFIAGDTLTMADIPIACEVHRWWGLPQPRPAWPHLERWYARWLAHAGSRGVLDLPLS
jgi:glutathione S-transferase